MLFSLETTIFTTISRFCNIHDSREISRSLIFPQIVNSASLGYGEGDGEEDCEEDGEEDGEGDGEGDLKEMVEAGKQIRRFAQI